ncbi:MAG: histidine kinase [Melioribacteraceae bacterium]|nr:histidine kinase [Melioribacteraceae bacterium]
MGGAIRWNPETNEYYHFTSEDGLLGEETNRDAFLYKDGLVYIGTDKGLSVFDPELHNTIDYGVKPKLKIVSLQDSENNDYDFNVPQQISYSNNTLTLQYRGLSFRNENSLQYKILIESLDDDTTETFKTTGTEYFIRNLNPGNYKIGVQVINDRGVESEINYTSEIKILAPFYLETWFLGLLVLLGFGISISIYDYINKNRYSRVLEKKVKIRTAQLEKSEESIRDLTQKLITAQESERQRISRDLHDNVSQDLAILKLELEKFGRAAHDIEKRKLTWLSDKLINMSKYIKDFTFFLHPSSIKQTGLINALQAMCNDFNEYSNTKIEFYSKVNGQIKLPEEVQTNLYRFVQEALANIRKHSNAASGIIIVSTKEDMLNFRIEDDGIGFNLEKVQANKSRTSMGLKSMEERILIAGGELKIKSAIGEGTKLFASVSMNPKN